MPRLFVAVRITPTDTLQSIVKRLAAQRGVKAVEPENLHCTIRFIGDVSDELAAAIKQVFDSGTLDIAPFDVAINGVGAFPHARDPRVIWAGADEAGDQGLKQIAHSIDDFLTTTGVGPRDKPFVSHLTLARVKRPAGRSQDELRHLLNEHHDTAFGTRRVERVHLVHSTLTQSGPVYDDIATLVLG